MTETQTSAAAPNDPPSNDSPPKEPVILATKVCGVVKWFSVKSGYGFISTPSYNENVFVHSKRIKYNNPKKLNRTLAEGETVEFDIMQGEKGHEAINVTGPDGRSVMGSQFAANKPKYGSRKRQNKLANKKKKTRRQKRKAKEQDDESPKDSAEETTNAADESLANSSEVKTEETKS